MKNIILFISAVWVTGQVTAQYKNDNVLYKTVYTEELCNELNKHPEALLLDVRTPGEYMDTSSRGTHLGRFKNAVNIEVGQLGKRLAEISDQKDKPVFVYCSHSQRSRRASKMLADSGFTQVFNINAGMTGVLQLEVSGNPCIYAKLESNGSYAVVSATDLCSKLSKKKSNIFLLDVRTDSAFKQISLDVRNNSLGHFKNSVNIPLANLEAGLSLIPRGKEIIIIDLFGTDAAAAADLLVVNNFKNVSVLLEGVYQLYAIPDKKLPCLSTAFESKQGLKKINAEELKDFMEATKDFIFLDVRTADEFNNKHKNYWQNLGHLKNAVHIPAADIETQWKKIEAFKSKPVIVYAFSGNIEVYETANTLVKKGFTNVMVLHGGIFNVGWTAANIKGFSSLADLRVDIPDEN